MIRGWVRRLTLAEAMGGRPHDDAYLARWAGTPWDGIACNGRCRKRYTIRKRVHRG